MVVLIWQKFQGQDMEVYFEMSILIYSIRFKFYLVLCMSV